MKTTKKVLSLALSCIASLTLAGTAFGQELTSGSSSLEGEEKPSTTGTFTLTPGFTHLFETDFDDAPGKLSVTRADVRAFYTLKRDQAECGIGALYELSHYDLDSAGEENFNRLGLSAYHKAMLNDNWGYFVFGAVELAASADATLKDGLMGTGAGGARYVWSDKLSLGFGAAFSSSLEDDNRVLPVIILNWQINDRWALRTLNGVIVTYDISGKKQTILDASVKYQLREYRLPANSAFGTGSEDSSLIEKMVTGEIGVTHHFNENIALRAFVGLVAARKYEFHVDGNEVGDEDMKTGGMAGIRAVFTF